MTINISKESTLLSRLSIAAVLSSVLWGQTGDLPFEKGAYVVLENAGCRACHNSDGVAAGTRLLFPEGNVNSARIEAFGRSLVTLVDRVTPCLAQVTIKTY